MDAPNNNTNNNTASILRTHIMQDDLPTELTKLVDHALIARVTDEIAAADARHKLAVARVRAAQAVLDKARVLLRARRGSRPTRDTEHTSSRWESVPCLLALPLHKLGPRSCGDPGSDTARRRS
jgi:hypothetical protein